MQRHIFIRSTARPRETTSFLFLSFFFFFSLSIPSCWSVGFLKRWAKVTVTVGGRAVWHLRLSQFELWPLFLHSWQVQADKDKEWFKYRTVFPHRGVLRWRKKETKTPFFNLQGKLSYHATPCSIFIPLYICTPGCCQIKAHQAALLERLSSQCLAQGHFLLYLLSEEIAASLLNDLMKFSWIGGMILTMHKRIHILYTHVTYKSAQ